MTYSQMLEQHHGSEVRMTNALERGDLRKEEVADGVFAYFYPQIKRAPSPYRANVCVSLCCKIGFHASFNSICNVIV
jgi:hypothetical protein